MGWGGPRPVILLLRLGAARATKVRKCSCPRKRRPCWDGPRKAEAASCVSAVSLLTDTPPSLSHGVLGCPDKCGTGHPGPADGGTA